MSVYQTVTQTYESQVLPLYISHSASQTPIVGTNIDYFDVRSLKLKQVAYLWVSAKWSWERPRHRSLISKWDSIRSDLQNLYNLAGSYPMTLTVVGILEPSGTADDAIVVADLKTVWALDGLLHGHEEVTANNALNGDEAEENLEATAIFMFSELSERNRDSFHLHGSVGEMPLVPSLYFQHSKKNTIFCWDISLCPSLCKRFDPLKLSTIFISCTQVATGDECILWDTFIEHSLYIWLFICLCNFDAAS